MTKKIGICTLYTGYNVGSSLQAYATKEYLKNKGYDSKILKIKGSIVKGRDIRVKKLFITIIRMFIFSNKKLSVIKSFFENKKKSFNEKTIQKFDKFYIENLQPIEISYSNLKKESLKNKWDAFICGSDQIWNSTAFYVDPFYYLQFVSKNKRIAYAPSFGRDYLPDYNKSIIKKYIGSIPYISVREATGKRIIDSMMNRNVEICLDPTFLLKKEEWIKILNLKKEERKKYIFCYFLNEPSKKVLKFISNVSKNNNFDVVFFNKGNKDVLYGGPIDFLNLLYNANIVFTDSFHGTAFSINFNKEFYVFERQYITDNQSTRIISLLDMFNLSKRYELYNIDKKIDYKNINLTLEEKRKSSEKYLEESIKKVI